MSAGGVQGYLYWLASEKFVCLPCLVCTTVFARYRSKSCPHIIYADPKLEFRQLELGSVVLKLHTVVSPAFKKQRRVKFDSASESSHERPYGTGFCAGTVWIQCQIIIEVAHLHASNWTCKKGSQAQQDVLRVKGYGITGTVGDRRVGSNR